jgi:hypothetical protein
MAAPAGGGSPWQALGALGYSDQSFEGVIGGEGQSATLLATFSLSFASSVFLEQLPRERYTDRYIEVLLQTASGQQVALGQDGRAVGVDIANTAGDESLRRLPPGDYAVVITTSQWQPAPFAFRLRVFPRTAPSLALIGRGAVGKRITTMRPETFQSGRGRLVASLQPRISIALAALGSARLRMGLQIIPAYETPEPLGLGHAWFSRRAQVPERLTIIAATGLSSAAVLLPSDFPGYIATRLTLEDFRRLPGRRVIFSDRSQGIYASYPELGVNPNITGAQESPDTPGVPFARLANGRHQREVLLGLPLSNSQMVVAHVEEVLVWNNDIIRDVDITRPLVQLLTVTNQRSSFAHRRRVSVFIVDRDNCRKLVRPPTELLARLDVILPPLDQFLVDRGIRVPGPTTFPPVARVLHPDFIAQKRLPSEGDRVLGADPTDTVSGLLKSLGMTNLLKADSTMNSAAIYTLLNDWEAIRAKDDYDPLSTSFVLSQLPDRPDGLPNLSPWYVDGGYRALGGAAGAYLEQAAQLLRYGQWSGPLPAEASTGVSSADPRWSLAPQGLLLPELRLFRSESPKLLLAYDWNQGTYCREKLQGLGFTTEDLSTDFPLTQGKAALNPGVARPLGGKGRLYLGELSASQPRLLRSTMNGQGSMAESNLSWCLRVRLHGRGSLPGATLNVTSDLTIVRRLLLCRLRGAGGIPSDVRDRTNRLSGRGGFMPTKLSSRPVNEYPQSFCTGQGRLQGTLVSS